MVAETIFADLPRSSRIHPLPFFSTNVAHVFIKREDELGPLSMGTKIRKYLSLLPFLKNLEKRIAISGSIFSNNVLSLSLLCKQHRIPYTLFLDRPRNDHFFGNPFYLFLAHNMEQIRWLDELYTKQAAMSEHPDLFWLAEGSSDENALPGSLTLADDILKNQETYGVKFDHIFTDAGTGFSASALHVGLSGSFSSSCLHIVQTAGKSEDFFAMHNRVWRMGQKRFGPHLHPIEMHHYLPLICPSFGSCSKRLACFIQEFARHEGIFLDPMYNAKLFFTAKAKMEELLLQGNILIIHSGGTLSLSGFSEKFSQNGL